MQMVLGKGPKFGYTKLILWGFGMDTGSEAKIADSPCIIVDRKNDKVEWWHSQAERQGQSTISLSSSDQSSAAANMSTQAVVLL